MNSEPDNTRDYDLTGMIIRPLYFGMLVNIVIPAGLLFVCYYINGRYPLDNQIPTIANALFYVFCVISFGQAALALWWRNRKLQAPMVHRAGSFEHDVGTAIYERSRPVFLLIASITVWAYVYFGLTGRFHESVVYVLFSFLVFQVVRPRYGSVKKLIAHQEELVRDGRFASGSLADIRKEIESQ
ncbi:MAG: hypothetical protein AB1772_09880 [Candidatus Zixiibacteriota bacterium]